MRSKQVLVLSALLLIACLRLHAERLPIKTYTTADGLAHNGVNRIVKDSRGFLWFCTEDGLSRFDGYTFTNFGTDQGLPHSSVNDLLETRHGEYWVATNGGLVRFDPKGVPGRVAYGNESMSPAPMFLVLVPDDQIRRAREITVLREGRDGTIWVGTNNGLYRLERANDHQLLRPVDIRLPNDNREQREIADVVEDAAGTLWIATPRGLYRRWADGSTAHYTRHDGLPDEYLSDLLEDHEGHLWAATRKFGFFRVRANGSHAAPVVDRTFTEREGLPTVFVFQLFEGSDNRFWIATARGLVEFLPDGDAQGHSFRSYTTANGLSYFDVTTLNEDLDGNLWLGTNAAGAMKLARAGLRTYGERDGIQAVSAIFEDQAGNVCFRGTVLDTRTSIFEGAALDGASGQPASLHTRLGCFDGSRFDWFNPVAVTHFGWVGEGVTLQARSGEWWVGTGEGLYRFPASNRFAGLRSAQPLTRYTMKDGLAALQVFRLFEDSRGDIWISTIEGGASNGLARWDAATGTLRDLGHSPGMPSLNEDLPRSFGEDASGNVWIGFNGGLGRYSRGLFTYFTAAHGLPPGAIMAIHVDHSGRLWLASERGGLVRVDDAAAARPRFITYTTTQGLASNRTEVLTEDVSGHIYIGGGHGLDRLDPLTGHVKHFTTTDGLPPGRFLAAFRDHTGVLWFGMSSGLARLAPAPEKPSGPPPVLITGLRVAGVREIVSALGERNMSLPDLAPGRNQIQIDFVGLSFGAGEVLRYQFRLEGADADWSALTEQRTVTYAALSPRRYRFRVRAVNSDGIVSAHPATISFTLMRPVWQRWWFLALMALGIALTIDRLYRYRAARLLDVANMRTRIATDLHDDIGANLTRIAILSEVARQTYGGDRGPQADGSLASIARIARESVSSMSDIVWAVNPARDTLRDLIRKMRQHAEEIFTTRGIEVHFDAPVAMDTLKLGVDVRRDLLLIFKEAVNNAARHSRCSSVTIALRVEVSRLTLTVADNGVGFDIACCQNGQGLTSIQRRADELNGTLEIASTPGAGTVIQLSTAV
jgi:ligand-binding sensor domain-containing protein/signal transduction histidine kinase